MYLKKRTKVLYFATAAVLLLTVAMLGLFFGSSLEVAAATTWENSKGTPTAAMTTGPNGNCDGNHTGSTALTLLSISTGGDYHLTDNNTATSDLTITSNITVNLCLNGKTLDMTIFSVKVSHSGGVLNIYDCSQPSTGKITGTSNSGTISLSGGSLNLYGGTIENAGTTQSCHAIYNQRAGAITVSGGKVSSTKAYAIYNNGAGTVTINGSASLGSTSATTYNGARMNGGNFTMTGGAIYANNYAIYNNSTGAVDIGSGTVSSGNDTIYNYSTGTVNVSGGIVSSSTLNAIYNYGAGTVTISGTSSLGTKSLKTNRGAHMNGGNFTMTGGAIYATNNAINNNGTGAVDIGSGTVSSGNSAAIYNEAAGDVTISGSASLGTALDTTRNGVRMGGGKFTMTGGAIYANSYAIYNNSTGATDISGGTLTSKINHTIWNQGAGAINISGSAVSVVASTNKYPIYNGGVGAIYLSGTPSISGDHDGEIYLTTTNTLVANDGNTSSPTHYTGKAIAIRYKSTSAEIPTSCDGDIIVSGVSSSNYSKFTLVNPTAGYGLKYDSASKTLKYGNRQNHICNGIIFDNELSVFSATLGAGNYVLMDNITATSVLTIASNATVNLCLNGNTLNMINFAMTVASGATLNIYDCTGSVGKITGSNSTYGALCLDGGSLNLHGGTITYTGAEKSTCTIYNKGTGTITVSGGSVSSANAYAIYNNAAGNVTISGSASLGTDVAKTNYGVYMNGGAFTMTGGAVYATNYTIHNNNIGAIDISGGTVSSENDYAIYNYNAGAVTISGGTVTRARSHAIYNNSTGTVNISGGAVSSTGNYAVYNYGAGIITISGGTVSSTSNYAVYNHNKGTITVSGGGVSSGNNYAIYNNGAGTISISGNAQIGTLTNLTYNGVHMNNGGTFTMTGGVISATQYAIRNYNIGTIDISGGTVSSVNDHAIYNQGAFTIHISGGTISSTKSYAICNSANGKIFLSGTPSVTGGENGTIYLPKAERLVANNGNTGSPTYYTGNTIDIRYENEYSPVATSCNNDIVVSGVNDKNKDKFTLVNAGVGYGLKYDSANGNLAYKNTAYGVTHTLANITATENTAGDNKAPNGEVYTTTLAANAGYGLPSAITVTIGGAVANQGPDYTYANGAITIDGAKVTGAIVIVANGVAQEYSITFNSVYGSPVSTITQDYNTSVAEPTAPTEIGFIFGGWYTDDNTFLNSYTFSTMPIDGIALFAKWSIADFGLSVSGDSTIQKDADGNITAIYDGVTHTLVSALSVTSKKIVYSYQWKENGSAVGNTLKSFAYSNATASNLELTVTATNSSGSLTKTQIIVFNLTVDKATYNMTAVDFVSASKVYHGQAQTIAISGDLPSGVTVTYSEGLKEVGSATITATFATANENYNIPESKTATLTITKREISVTIADQMTAQGGELVNLATAANVWTVTNGTLVQGDDLGIVLTSTADKNIIAVTAINGTATNKNYQITFTTGEYTVFSIADFNQFIASHGDTIDFVVDQITYAQALAIKAMHADYINLDIYNLLQLTDTQKEKISALNEKAADVAVAKMAAEKALIALKEITATGIRDNNSAYLSAEALIKTATNKIADYKGLSSGLKELDLNDFALLFDATQKLNLEKVKVVAIKELTAEREKLLSSSAYSAAAKKEIAEYYDSAIENITLATEMSVIAENKDSSIVKMNEVEVLHIGLLVANLIFALLLVGEILFLVFRKKLMWKKNGIKTYSSFLPLALLASASGGGLAVGVTFLVILILAVVVLGIYIADKVLRELQGKTLFSPLTDKIDALIAKVFSKKTLQAQIAQAPLKSALGNKNLPTGSKKTVQNKPSKQADTEENYAFSKAQTPKANVAQLVRKKITLQEAQSILTDEVAAALVETQHAKSSSKKAVQAAPCGKRGIVNVDTLSEAFSSGETVTISSLKAKKLIAQHISSVKILARGTLDKPLSIEAQDFSIDSVKMILLTGGKVIKITQ